MRVPGQFKTDTDFLSRGSILILTRTLFLLFFLARTVKGLKGCSYTVRHYIEVE